MQWKGATDLPSSLTLTCQNDTEEPRIKKIHIYSCHLKPAVAEPTELKMSATAGDKTILMRIVLIACLLLSLGFLSLSPPLPAATSRNARKSRYIVISGNLLKLSHHDAFRSLCKLQHAFGALYCLIIALKLL